jgi:hypothetical protein
MKYKGDNDGFKKGALGKFDKGAKLDRNYDPWNPKVLSDGLSDGKGAYTSNDVSFLNRKPSDTPRYDPTGSEKVKVIYDDVCKNSLDDDAGGSRPGPIKYGVD